MNKILFEHTCNGTWEQSKERTLLAAQLSSDRPRSIFVFCEASIICRCFVFKSHDVKDMASEKKENN